MEPGRGDHSYAFGRCGRLNELKLSLIGARSTAAPREEVPLFQLLERGGVLSGRRLKLQLHAYPKHTAQA